MKLILKIGFFLALLGAVAAGYQYYQFAVQPVASPGTELIVDVPPQSTFFTVRNSLASQGVPIDRFAFRAWTTARDANRRLRVGEYKINTKWSRLRILDEILSGQQLLHKLTVKEGFNIWDIENEIRNSPLSKLQDSNSTATAAAATAPSTFINLAREEKYLERMGVPPAPAGVVRSLEGFLFPETYSYQKYDTKRKVLEAMLAQFEDRALPLLKSHPWGETPQGRYRLLTLASIVEKESGLASEQPLIASVFWNRLNKRMKLQSDPTTIYGLLPNFDGNIRKSQLLASTPYNTYTLPELPAGPISNPGESAIRAVLQPQTSRYIFFVSRGDGTHVFSETLQQHNAYVREYQLRRSPTTTEKR